jgi:hypothetical protein
VIDLDNTKFSQLDEEAKNEEQLTQLLLTVKNSIDGEGLDCDTLNSIIQGVTIETKNLDAAPDELQVLYRDEESPR